MLPRAVDLLALDYQEAIAVRFLLEYIGVRVTIHLPGLPREVLDVLVAQRPCEEHLILCCHGDDRGIVMDELAPELYEGQPFTDRLTPEVVAREASLGGRTVVITGCGTGGHNFADAFLSAGAAVYVGPDGYPQDALFFLSHLYYGLRGGLTIDGAVASARDHEYGDTQMFRLWRRLAT